MKNKGQKIKVSHEKLIDLLAVLLFECFLIKKTNKKIHERKN